jgi:hypothetical protein
MMSFLFIFLFLVWMISFFMAMGLGACHTVFIIMFSLYHLFKLRSEDIQHRYSKWIRAQGNSDNLRRKGDMSSS